jgi:Lar family restriction alleviation protein
MAEKNLKICPFCGSNDVAPEEEYGSDCGYDFGGHIVICNNCGAQTKYYETEAEAIGAWNMRADNDKK